MNTSAKMNIPITKLCLGEEEVGAVREVLKSGWLVQGDKVVQFEDMVKALVKTKHATACTSCTTALHMSLLALGVGKKDRVAVPAYTFVATPNVVEYVGGEVVFVDIDLETFNIDVDALQKVKRVRTAIPVHLFGLCANMPRIMRWARVEKVTVVEDAACSLGASCPEGMAGSIGDIACFPHQTRILTERGKVRIKDINEGDKVKTVSGGYGTVTKVFKRKYDGPWTKLVFPFARNRDSVSSLLTMTEEHPVLIYRNGTRVWEKAKNLTENDWVYVHKSTCRVCGKDIPTFWSLCEYCNPSQTTEARAAISAAKNTGKERPVYHFNHYYNDILPYADKLSKEGYRVVPIGVSVPDIIGLKDGKVFAFEIENRIPRKRKLLKYTEETKRYYDDIIWVARERKKSERKVKINYVAEDDMVRVKINEIKRYHRAKPVTVFNLEVSGDHTYFAGGYAVHNCFSFHPRKSVTTGEGGMMTTNRDDLARTVHALRDFGFTITDIERHKSGQTVLPQVEMLGYNYRMTNIQGAIGVEQMKKYDYIIGERVRRAEIYNRELAGLDWLRLPVVPLGSTHTYQSYCLLVGGSNYQRKTESARDYIEKWSGTRDRLIATFKDKGISIRGGTHACHMLTYYARKYNLKPLDFPNTAIADALLVTIPLFAAMTDNEQRFIIDAIKEVKA